MTEQSLIPTGILRRLNDVGEIQVNGCYRAAD